MNTSIHLFQSLCVCLLVSFLGCSSSLPERCEDRNPVFVDGKKNKEEWRCYDSGSWKFAREWQDGKVHGKWTGWHANGKKYYETHYKNDKKERKWAQWWSNGQKQSEGSFRNGAREGQPLHSSTPQTLQRISYSLS
jgi:hypothetical protein